MENDPFIDDVPIKNGDFPRVSYPIWMMTGATRPQSSGIRWLQLHGGVQVFHGTHVVLQHQPATMSFRNPPTKVMVENGGLELGKSTINEGYIGFIQFFSWVYNGVSFSGFMIG